MVEAQQHKVSHPWRLYVVVERSEVFHVQSVQVALRISVWMRVAIEFLNPLGSVKLEVQRIQVSPASPVATRIGHKKRIASTELEQAPVAIAG